MLSEDGRSIYKSKKVGVIFINEKRSRSSDFLDQDLFDVMRTRNQAMRTSQRGCGLSSYGGSTPSERYI